MYSDLLSGVNITNVCALDVINRYKGDRSAFIFLDPPYFDCDDMYNNPSREHLIGLYKGILALYDRSESNLLMIVRETDFIREVFSKYIKDEYSVIYSHNTKSNKNNKHLVIKNY